MVVSTRRNTYVASSETGPERAYDLEAGASAFHGLVQTDVVTAQPSASTPKKVASDSAKRNRPSQTASQSSLSLGFM